MLKNVAGYDLTHLLIGSEGTLAVVTAALLRLLPLPRCRRLVLAAFASLESAASAVSAVFRAGVVPSALEFMERSAVAIVEGRQGRKFPNGSAEAQLFIELDGNHPEALDADLQALASALEPYAPLDVVLAESAAKVEEVWNLRRGLGEAVKSVSAYREEDTVVPRDRLPELIRGVKDIGDRYGVTTVCYGHAGDGNVHVNVLRGDLTPEGWREDGERAVREIITLAVGLGGTISGEHGIGWSQKNYLPLGIGAREISIMRHIKQTLDPKGILNPGKIFPDVPV